MGQTGVNSQSSPLPNPPRRGEGTGTKPGSGFEPIPNRDVGSACSLPVHTSSPCCESLRSTLVPVLAHAWIWRSLTSQIISPVAVAFREVFR